jgi:hypothetical protein
MSLWVGHTGQGSGTLPKDFRYRLKGIITENFYSVRLRVSASFTNRGMSAIDGDLLANCEANGCRDEVYTPASYSCNPCLTPTRTRSKTPSPTSSRSKMPSPTRSPLVVFVASNTYIIHFFDATLNLYTSVPLKGTAPIVRTILFFSAIPPRSASFSKSKGPQIRKY